jgi:hypothetical protein
MRPALVVACCVLGLGGGCAGDPGSMTQSEVEARLKDTLNLKVVSLTARPDGGYTGTGQTADGTTYAITVDQKAADRSLWYTATSDGGEIQAGGFRQFGPPWLRPLKQARNWGLVALAVVVVIGGGVAVARKLARGNRPADPAAPDRADM